MGDSGSHPSEPTDYELALRTARQTLPRRAVRKNILGTDVRLGEPAWDMMIDLFIHEGEGKPVSTSSICIASGLPMSTALRLLQRLCDLGKVTRIADPSDGRRNFIRLAPEVREQLTHYFSTYG
jgi:DNA repair protein RadC